MRQIVPILIAGVLGGGLPAWAQNTVPDQTQQSPGPTPVFSDTVVVSASLDAEEREDSPASATILDAQRIQDRQANTLSDLAATVPGLTVVQAGAAGQQTSIFTRGTDSDQTLLLWNGIQLNDPFFGGANWQFVPLDGVERVEVVRGPFSTLYGSNAVGGVVQVFTGSRQGGTVTLEGGEDGYGRGGVAAGADLGRVRFDVTGHVRRGGGELENDEFDSQEGVARALWSFGDGMSVGLLARANDSKTGIPFSGSRLTPDRRISWRENELAVPFRSERGPWEVEAQLSRAHFDSAFRDPDDPSGFTASDTESEALRGRAVASWRRGEDLRIAFGAEAERLDVTNGSSFGSNLDGAHQRTWAAFGEASWGRGPVRLEAGLRRDDNDVYGAETSLRAGTVVKLGGNVRLRASYGEAFRAPSLGELFFPGSGNPDLQPEDSRSWEVGIEREADGWRFGLTGFENRLSNLIDFDFATFRNVNVGRARSRGVEGEAGFSRGLFAALANATWLDTEDLDTGLELLRRPKESANLTLSLRPGPWTFTLTGLYVGDRPDVDPSTFERTENPSFTRVDLAARWRALAWLSPYARVENLGDEEYSAALGYPSPGRTLIGGLAFDF
ncbi:MAG: TonB-dependent receptor domain-containing protein [Thermoanaerobaculia bacterium]